MQVFEDEHPRPVFAQFGDRFAEIFECFAAEAVGDEAQRDRAGQLVGFDPARAAPRVGEGLRQERALAAARLAVQPDRPAAAFVQQRGPFTALDAAKGAFTY
ncbi:hypothetical protein LCL61_15240 [Amycolatopsis coloradensis]|uniref:Uncharacterized protein n=1 Tax=Amycolatopsis coloradensis TaxID=76021 RepID=A0ACD5BBX4_9PSEU